MPYFSTLPVLFLNIMKRGLVIFIFYPVTNEYLDHVTGFALACMLKFSKVNYTASLSVNTATGCY